MGNGKITKELKGLGTTINGKEPNGETVSQVIKGINDDYEGSGTTVKILETSNITGLTTEQCEALNVGDVVIKLTSNQKHTYTVSYKEAGVGMCLTYVDASTSETVSYDYTGGQWVYNSIDITNINTVVANPTLAGTEANLTGLQVGDTRYAMPHLYEYIFTVNFTDQDNLDFYGCFRIISTQFIEINVENDLYTLMKTLPTATGGYGNIVLSSGNENYVSLYYDKSNDKVVLYASDDNGKEIELNNITLAKCYTIQLF